MRVSSKNQKKEKKQKNTTQLGKKHICYKCGTKFYDLGKAEIICPRCGANQKEAPKQELSKSTKQKKTSPRITKPKTPPEEVIEVVNENEVYIEDAFGYDITVQDDEGFDEFEE